MQADNEVLERKARDTEAMRQRVIEMEEVKKLMEQQVQDYTIYEVIMTTWKHNCYCKLLFSL